MSGRGKWGIRVEKVGGGGMWGSLGSEGVSVCVCMCVCVRGGGGGGRGRGEVKRGLVITVPKLQP